MNTIVENGWWVIGWGWIISLIILVLLIWVIVRITRQYSNSSDHKSAMDLLKERYARGEISKTEFEEKKRDIL